MKHTLLLLLFPFAATVAFSQISRNQWLVGGTGSFDSYHSSNSLYHDLKYTTISLNPDIGYFLLNHLAVGLRLNYDYNVEKGPGTDSDRLYNKGLQTNLSPFVRYYLLPQRRKFNILTEASENWMWENHKSGIQQPIRSHDHSYTFSAGPVWFITPSAALELTLNYTHDDELEYNNDYHISVGFQLHFGKVKKKSSSH